jgi:uncharacterized protein
MQIIRRDVRFALPPDRINDWHAQGPAVTQLFNAMSLLFPAGERFFIDAVRHYRDQVADPELAQQVAGFIGQEAMHTREHIEYNDLLERAGLPAVELDAFNWAFVARMRRIFSSRRHLAATMALEHYTAMLAHRVLKEPQHMVGGEAAYTQMWQWHALEETEHKSVSFDVWRAVFKPSLYGYFVRCSAMLTCSLTFWSMLFGFHVTLLRHYRRRTGKIGLGNLWRLLKFVWGPQGMIPSMALDWLSYFRPGFHPWHHDNRADLAQIAALLDGVEQANQAHAAQAAPRRVPLHPDARAIA